MARVTVADCIEVVPSRFQLVILAAHRAKEISAGAPIMVERHNDKNPVIALREIAARKLDPQVLEEAIIKKHQRMQATEVVDRPDEEELSEEITKMIMPMTVSEIDADELADGFSEEISNDDE